MKKEISKGLNKYLADTAVLYIKLHNLHWNVVGKQFKSVHEYLEVLYDGFADVLDATAEMLKINEETPLASLKDYLAVAEIKELDSVEVSVAEVLDVVASDIAYMKQSAESIRKEADEADEYSVVSLMEGDLENYNKTLWFVKSMLK